MACMIRNYRKKISVIYAEPLRPRARSWPPRVYEMGRKFYVKTANGDVLVKPGDMICWQYVKGKMDVWPVALRIFEATYERA